MKKNILLVVIILVLIIAIVIWLMMDNNETADDSTTTSTTTESTNSTVIEEPTSDTNTSSDTNSATDDTTTTSQTNIINLLTFTSAPTDWYEHIWYNAADAEGEVTYSADGVTFTGLKSNSRSGIKTDLELDVSEYSELNLSVSVTNTTQTLTGTGYNGREAPVAVAVSYTDTDGVKHAGLGEDPTAPGQIFWRGFYSLDPNGSSGIVNGVKVTAGQPYDFTFDLMTLDPAPATLHYIGLEGAGWQERVGTVHSLQLVGVK